MEVDKQEIREDLLEQLRERNIVESHYIDLVNDYIALWEIKNELIKDIKEKGVSVKYQNGANQWGYKKNDSVRELTNVNNQMLKILNDLGLKPAKVEVEQDEEFEL